MKRIVILINLLFILIVPAQTVYEIPAGSENNILEIEIENSTGTNLEEILLIVENLPDFVLMKKQAEIFSKIENNVVKAEFKFDITQEIVAGKEGKLNFKIVSQNKILSEKEIKLKITAPEITEMEQNYPNPFNPSTEIKYTLSRKGKVELKVYDILGREATVLVDEEKEAGIYRVKFEPAKYRLASGVYVYRLKTGNYSETKKMLYLK